MRMFRDDRAGIKGVAIRCLMYDGCVVEFDIANARRDLIDSAQSISASIGIGDDAKQRGRPEFSRIAPPLRIRFSGEGAREQGGYRAKRNPDSNRTCLFAELGNLIRTERP